MKSEQEGRKAISSSESEEIAKVLENLDGNSIVLAKMYMTALSDRQKFEKTKLAVAGFRRCKG